MFFTHCIHNYFRYFKKIFKFSIYFFFSKILSSKLSLNGTPMNNNVINYLFSLDLPLNTLSSWHLRKSKTLTVPSSLQLANLESVGQKLWNLKVKKMWFGSLFIHLNIIKKFQISFLFCIHEFPSCAWNSFSFFEMSEKLGGIGELFFISLFYFILFYLG
jgi:hypothetical protein